MCSDVALNLVWRTWGWCYPDAKLVLNRSNPHKNEHRGDGKNNAPPCVHGNTETRTSFNGTTEFETAQAFPSLLIAPLSSFTRAASTDSSFSRRILMRGVDAADGAELSSTAARRFFPPDDKEKDQAGRKEKPQPTQDVQQRGAKVFAQWPFQRYDVLDKHSLHEEKGCADDADEGGHEVGLAGRRGVRSSVIFQRHVAESTSRARTTNTGEPLACIVQEHAAHEDGGAECGGGECTPSDVFSPEAGDGEGRVIGVGVVILDKEGCGNEENGNNREDGIAYDIVFEHHWKE
ncbi:hypothetical protein B0H14DRAFT_2571127 [Mycena olivaceomarginata]|nr:hypothetical protein B0H14DRAFT_2571127 [Mycena olivaceomarginata]